MLEKQALAGDLDLCVEVARKFQGVPSPLLMLYLKRRSDVGDRGGFGRTDILF